MLERKNTIVCSFDPSGPRITAFDVHEWLFLDLKVQYNSVIMVQIDGARRQMYIKFTDMQYVIEVLTRTNGAVDYRHTTGEISRVTIELVLDVYD